MSTAMGQHEYYWHRRRFGRRSIRKRELLLGVAVLLLIAGAAFLGFGRGQDSKVVVVRIYVQPLAPCIRESGRGIVVAIIPGHRQPSGVSRGLVGRLFPLRLRTRRYAFYFSRSDPYRGIPLLARGSSGDRISVDSSSPLVLVPARGCQIIPTVPD